MLALEHPLLLSGGLCAAMMLCSQIGYRLGLRRRRDMTDQFGLIDGAVLALLGLLLGFTLQTSMNRMGEARRLVVQEATAIGTAYLRLDLLEPSGQADIRRLFRDYLEARLRVYDTVRSSGDPSQPIAQASELQQRIWAEVVQASRSADAGSGIRVLLIPAVNEMIDVTTARFVAFSTRLPALIVSLLLGVAALSSLLVGYAMAAQKHRGALHVVVFSLIVSATIYVLLDLDNPRSGLVTLDVAEQTLRTLHDSIR